MRNRVPKSSEWLASVGIHTLDDVTKLGVVETYKRVKAADREKVSLNMLWGLQAARLDIPGTNCRLISKKNSTDKSRTEHDEI